MILRTKYYMIKNIRFALSILYTKQSLDDIVILNNVSRQVLFIQINYLIFVMFLIFLILLF